MNARSREQRNLMGRSAHRFSVLLVVILGTTCLPAWSNDAAEIIYMVRLNADDGYEVYKTSGPDFVAHEPLLPLQRYAYGYDCAFDSTGQWHVVYNDYYREDNVYTTNLYYATPQGTTLLRTCVSDLATETGLRVYRPRIALDGSNVPTIIYGMQIRASGVPQVQTVYKTTGPDFASHDQLFPPQNFEYYYDHAFDSAGQWHLAYGVMERTDTLYTSRLYHVTGEITTQVRVETFQDEVGRQFAYCSIALDSSDTAHIVYGMRVNWSDGYEVHKSVGPTFTSHEQILPLMGSQYYFDYGFDAAGQWHLAYTDTGRVDGLYTSRLYHATAEGSTLLRTETYEYPLGKMLSYARIALGQGESSPAFLFRDNPLIEETLYSPDVLAYADEGGDTEVCIRLPNDSLSPSQVTFTIDQGNSVYGCPADFENGYFLVGGEEAVTAQVADIIEVGEEYYAVVTYHSPGKFERTPVEGQIDDSRAVEREIQFITNINGAEQTQEKRLTLVRPMAEVHAVQSADTSRMTVPKLVANKPTMVRGFFYVTPSMPKTGIKGELSVYEFPSLDLVFSTEAVESANQPKTTQIRRRPKEFTLPHYADLEGSLDFYLAPEQLAALEAGKQYHCAIEFRNPDDTEMFTESGDFPYDCVASPYTQSEPFDILYVPLPIASASPHVADFSRHTSRLTEAMFPFERVRTFIYPDELPWRGATITDLSAAGYMNMLNKIREEFPLDVDCVVGVLPGAKDLPLYGGWAPLPGQEDTFGGYRESEDVILSENTYRVPDPSLAVPNSNRYDPWGAFIPCHEIGHAMGWDHPQQSPTVGPLAIFLDKYGSPAEHRPMGSTVVTANTPRAWLMDTDVKAWISATHFEQLLDQLTTKSAAKLWRPVDAAKISGTFLRIAGAISLTDEIEVYDSELMDSVRRVSVSAEGAYSVVIRDVGGAVLTEHTFDLDFASHGLEWVGFVHVLDWPSGASSVEITHNGATLYSATITAGVPAVTVVSPNGGETMSGQQTVSWSASDADSATLWAALYYSADDGATYNLLVSGIQESEMAVDFDGLPGSATARIRVVVSDGFNIGEDSSDGAFTVSPKAPQAGIISPPNGTVLVEGETLVCEGSAYDLEDGELDGAVLTWSSDVDGSLGTGNTLIVSSPLTAGTHIITLDAMDSDSGHGYDTVTIEVMLDSDGDGLPDDYEAENGLDDGTDDTSEDPDGDGLDNSEEYAHGTSPQLADTDGDGHSDFDELAEGTDPLNAASYPGSDGSQVVIQGPSTVVFGVEFSLVSVLVDESLGEVTYQWTHEGSDIEGETGSSLYIPEAAEDHAGPYTVKINDAVTEMVFESPPFELQVVEEMNATSHSALVVLVMFMGLLGVGLGFRTRTSGI